MISFSVFLQLLVSLRLADQFQQDPAALFVRWPLLNFKVTLSNLSNSILDNIQKLYIKGVYTVYGFKSYN